MNPIVTLAFVIAIVGAAVGSTRKITEGNEALVERLGRYSRKLSPGLNFGIIPFVDEVVIEADMREQILDISPDKAEATTKDNVRVRVDPVVFWRIFDLENAHYAIRNLEEGIENLVITTLRSEIGEMDLQQTNSGRDIIARKLLESLDEATEPWGVKVTRVEIQDIRPSSKNLLDALERERAAQSDKKAEIARAEGQKQAVISGAEAMAEAISVIKDALPPGASAQSIMNYLVAQRYVEANLQLGESENSKIVFMNPRDLTQSMAELISVDLQTSTKRLPGEGKSGNGSTV